MNTYEGYSLSIVCIEDIEVLAQKAREFETQDEEKKKQHENLVFGLPDQVLSRKEIFAKRLKLKKVLADYLEHHSYKKKPKGKLDEGIKM